MGECARRGRSRRAGPRARQSGRALLSDARPCRLVRRAGRRRLRAPVQSASVPMARGGLLERGLRLHLRRRLLRGGPLHRLAAHHHGLFGPQAAGGGQWRAGAHSLRLLPVPRHRLQPAGRSRAHADLPCAARLFRRGGDRSRAHSHPAERGRRRRRLHRARAASAGRPRSARHAVRRGDLRFVHAEHRDLRLAGIRTIAAGAAGRSVHRADGGDLAGGPVGRDLPDHADDHRPAARQAADRAGRAQAVVVGRRQGRRLRLLFMLLVGASAPSRRATNCSGPSSPRA